MKPKPAIEPDEPLGRVLREWAVETPLPPGFRDQVWHRIARREAQPEKTLWSGFKQLLGVMLPRPKFAFAYLTALFVFGVAAGSVTAQIKTSHVEANLSARYVQSVSPFQEHVPQP